MRAWEQQVCVVDDTCRIVDRGAMHIVGIGVPVSFESPGYGDAPGIEAYALNDYAIAKKYITDGTMALLAEALHVGLEDGIVCARHELMRDGNYRAVLGVAVDSLENLPLFLPENTVTLKIPHGRFAKYPINEQKRECRAGFGERMHADEHFIGPFRKLTPYLYDPAGVPMYVFDETGDILWKYEPVKMPTSEADRYESFTLLPVLLPPMKIACRVQRPGDDDFVISQYFRVQDEVFKTKLAQFYRPDYYGFPIDVPGGYASCFGSRVSSFEGLPDCVERITLPGGLYVHISQASFNGDNPTMCYEVAFEHLDKLFFAEHPAYAFDRGRKVIARFRQANCASVFAPVRRKGEEAQA